MAAGLGDHPLLGGSRFARAAVPGPTIGARSPATVDATADYIFGAALQPGPADLQANRLPDVDGGFRWSMQFRTDVQTAYDGTERRHATLARARDRYAGAFHLDDTDDRYIRSLLSRAPGSIAELPMPHEAVATLAAIGGGTIVIDPTYVDWLAAGRRVYVLGPAGDAYSTTITGVNGATFNVTSSPPSGGSFPAGATHVYPLESVRLDDGQTMGRWPVAAARWQFEARAVDFRALVGTGATLTTFDDLPVLDRRPRASGFAQEQVLTGLEYVDQGGSFTANTGWTRSAHRRTHDWQVGSPAERQWWKAFLRATRGRWKTFLCPTWRPDLVILSSPGTGEDEIIVAGDYLGEWWPSLAHRRIQLEFADGAVEYFGVASAVQDPGYDYQRLTLDHPVVKPDSYIVKLSLLETARLDTDEPSIEYSEGWRGRISLPLVTVQGAGGVMV